MVLVFSSSGSLILLFSYSMVLSFSGFLVLVLWLSGSLVLCFCGMATRTDQRTAPRECPSMCVHIIEFRVQVHDA